MDRILVVMVDLQSQVRAASDALLDLERQGEVAIYGLTILRKDALRVVPSYGFGLPEPLKSTSDFFEHFAEMLTAESAAASTPAAGMLELDDDFVGDVYATFGHLKYALVALIDEARVTPIDLRMESFGGTVLRRALHSPLEASRGSALSSLEADLAQLRDEVEHVVPEHRQRLLASIDELVSKRERAIKALRFRADAQEKQL